MSSPKAAQTPAGPPTCYRHPDHPTHVRCTRCDRYICPDCMRDAAVGQHCVECAHAGAKTVRRARVPVVGLPLVTYVLIGLNVAAFVGQSLSAPVQGALVLWPIGVAQGELYRLVTSVFLHNGMMHLLLNMWALYIVGPPLEAHLGRVRFGVLYGLSALGGSVAVYLLAPPNTATAGASGAVFGLFGAVFVVAKRLRVDVTWVVVLIGINLLLPLVAPRVSWQAHVGGLLTGALIAFAFVWAPAGRRTVIQTGVSTGVLVLFAALIWWRTTELLGVGLLGLS